MNRHARGLLIGPDESLAAFDARSSLPSISKFPEKLKRQFGISPDWVAITYQNQGLRFWEGGCSWISLKTAVRDGKVIQDFEPELLKTLDAHSQMVKGSNVLSNSGSKDCVNLPSPTAVFRINHSEVMIQLRRSFKERSSIWGLYSKEELLAHEAVHAARVAFDEPVFEEVLAYQTSKSAWRRYFGPFFRSPKEGLVFVASTALLFFSSLFASLYPFAFSWMLVLSTFGLLRLMRTQRQFKAALQKLTKLFGPPALGVMLHLTDKEIILCAKSSSKNIEAYFVMQTSPRFEQLRNECGVGLYCQSQALSDI